MTNKTIYLKDYQPAKYNPTSVNLEFDIQAEEVVVTAVSKWQRIDKDSKDIFLDGDGLQLVTVFLNEKQLDSSEYVESKEGLELKNVPDEFTLKIITKSDPSQNKQLMGLYKSGSMYCTQCESHGFRRITYFMDRPDVLSRYQVKIIADKQACPVLLSNGNLVETKSIDSKRHYAIWEDPHLKPSYLFALVAGNLVSVEDYFVTKSGRLVTLKVYVEHANLTKTQHAVQALQKSMAWDEKVYNREYDLDIYMIVAVDDFNMGAMENKGLNIFNSKYVLASPETATDADFANIDRVVGHEYFHNWSGNRVTCRDWFQLSLKEGLTVFREQSFMEDITKSPVSRIDQVQLLRSKQFAEDSGPMAHPVRPASYQEINNFYTLTVYEKGSEVIRMLSKVIGQDKFKEACEHYFECNDGRAATIEDFVASCEHASEMDLSQFKLWYSQAGTPTIKVLSEYDESAKTYKLSFEQVLPVTADSKEEKKAMVIPFHVGLLDPNGKEITLQTSAEDEGVLTKDLTLTQMNSSTTFFDVKEKPTPSLLRGFSSAVKVDYNYDNDELLHLFEHDTDHVNKWDAGQRLYATVALKDDSSLEGKYLDSLNKTLTDTELAPSFRAALLRMPGVDTLLNTQDDCDPSVLAKQLQSFAEKKAFYLQDTLLKVYKDNFTSGKYSYNSADVNKRDLKNTALFSLCANKVAHGLELCKEQYKTANNMTDKFSALKAMVNFYSKEAKEYIEDFYNTWSFEPLVVNKWLQVQATSIESDVFNTIASLTKHDSFSFDNPNKVYSLIGGYCIGNPGSFHDLNLPTYEFLEDAIIRLDAKNPQVAARMINPFTLKGKLTAKHQAKINETLQRISKHKLSKDISEIVEKTMR